MLIAPLIRALRKTVNLSKSDRFFPLVNDIIPAIKSALQRTKSRRANQ
ncbi:MAG: hypothetical protein A4E55_02390 [Pelotomaculum sp. PtaU1.Bin035]|nr:MAG: hypothetical protein A4E55_02390 [Pelotomaculum sp. PtaU1.Bin035]